MHGKTRQAGLTRLEFVLVSILFALLVGSFLYAVRHQQAQAEKLSVELTVMSLRTGLLSEIAQRLINHRGEDTADLIGGNPVRFLKSPPLGYLGEFKEIDGARLQPGSWYFDSTRGELVYHLNQSAGFRRLDAAAKNEIRWRVEIRDGLQRVNPMVDALSLLPLGNYEWL
ncbi:MAG: hypothetical protein PHT48_05790 [Dechloromonas sp.]|nr:hypothetical protein [Dechloromonas sp.]